MNQKEFEEKYAQMIPLASLEEIMELFKEKKKQYQNNKLNLWFIKLKENFNKSNSSKFIELGYESFTAYDFLEKIFDIALKNEREDVIEYLFNENYIDSISYSFKLSKTLSSKKVLSHILQKENIKNRFSSYHYHELLMKVCFKNLPEHFDLIINSNPEKIKNIEKKLQEKIVLESLKFNANEIFFKLIKMKEPLKIDINFQHYEYDLQNNKDNILIAAAKNNNIEVMKYLLTSKDLEKNVDIAESLYWIARMDNGKELLDTIIFDIKAPITPELENILKDDRLLEVFKKRDLFLKIDENLSSKGTKVKTNKI